MGSKIVSAEMLGYIMTYVDRLFQDIYIQRLGNGNTQSPHYAICTNHMYRLHFQIAQLVAKTFLIELRNLRNLNCQYALWLIMI